MSNAEISLGNRPKSARWLLVLAGLAAVGVIVLFVEYGTVAPCGILRESVRREAAHKGGFGGFMASVLPDSVMNGIIAERYGALTPARCTGILLGFDSPLAVATTPRRQVGNQSSAAGGVILSSPESRAVSTLWSWLFH